MSPELSPVSSTCRGSVPGAAVDLEVRRDQVEHAAEGRRQAADEERVVSQVAVRLGRRVQCQDPDEVVAAVAMNGEDSVRVPNRDRVCAVSSVDRSHPVCVWPR